MRILDFVSSFGMAVDKDLNGKVVIITGANCGIGYETALDLLKRNAHVIIACRDAKRGEHAIDKLAFHSKSEKVELELLDLASLESINDFSDRIHAKIDRLDILINNAGVAACPYTKTVDGFEQTFAVNHLGSNCTICIFNIKHCGQSCVSFCRSFLLNQSTS
jgi:retinol dehydrogenase-12